MASRGGVAEPGRGGFRGLLGGTVRALAMKAYSDLLVDHNEKTDVEKLNGGIWVQEP